MKSFFSKFLVFITICLSIVLVFSFEIRNVFITSLRQFVSNDLIVTQVKNSIKSEFNEFDSTYLNEIENRFSNSKELNDITSIYFDSIIYDIINDTNSKPDIKDNINLMIENNITYEMKPYLNQIKGIVFKIDFDNVYTDVLNYVNRYVNDKLKSIFIFYSLLNNFYTKLVSFVLILINLFILIILNKKESISNISKILNISSIIQIFILLILRGTFKFLDLSTIVIISIVELVLATVLEIINDKLLKKNK